MQKQLGTIRASYWMLNPRKGDGTVKLDSVDDIVGIYLEDRSVKCRDCMSEVDWKNLTDKQIITGADLRKDDEWIYCDYCEERL
jgi:hypothetical protein